MPKRSYVILFRAGIHPASKTQELDDKQVRNIFRALKTVLKKAIEADVDAQKMPRSYLFPSRKRVISARNIAAKSKVANSPDAPVIIAVNTKNN